MDKTKEIISVNENESKMERKVARMKDKKDKYEKAGESLEELAQGLEAAGKGMMGCGCIIIIGIILFIFVFLPILMIF